MSQTPNTTPAVAEQDGWKWWYYILAGIGFAGGAIYEYVDLTKFEMEGGTRRMHKILALAYETVGKWGVVAIPLILAVGCILVGISSYKSQKAAPPDSP